MVWFRKLFDFINEGSVTSTFDNRFPDDCRDNNPGLDDSRTNPGLDDCFNNPAAAVVISVVGSKPTSFGQALLRNESAHNVDYANIGHIMVTVT